MSDLKPCPFCGLEAIFKYPNFIHCEDTVNCGAEVTQGPTFDLDILADITIEAWNNRADGWVSVDERLPDYDIPVLVNNGNAIYCACLVCDGGSWFWAVQDSHSPLLNDKTSYIFDDDYYYAFWMPLPSPPEGDK